MPVLRLSRITIVWLALVLVTSLTWEAAIGTDFARCIVHVVSIVALLTAFFKIYLIGMEFMNLREAPLLMRSAFLAWVCLVCFVLIGMYLFGNSI